MANFIFSFSDYSHRKNAIIYPPVIREEILKLKPTIGNHIIVYQTSKESVKLIEKLKELDEKFIIYGFGIDKIDENRTRLSIYVPAVADFIPKRSIIDKYIRNKGEAIFLKDKVLPLFPFEICEKLFSLDHSTSSGMTI